MKKNGFRLKKMPIATILFFLLVTSHSYAQEVEFEEFPTSGILPIDNVRLVQEVVKRNAQILYSKLQSESTFHKYRSEAAIYEGEFFSSVRYDDKHVKNTASDKLSSIQRINQDVFDENNTNFEVGVRSIVQTGAELKISYTTDKKTNNTIGLVRNQEEASEFVNRLNLTLTQPLLQGLFNKQAEVRIEKSRLDYEISKAQFQQQLLKISSEALNAYWRLYSVREFQKMRQESLDNAHKSYEDVVARTKSGRLAETAILEARSNILKRQAELHNANLAVNEAHNRLKTLLALPASDYDQLDLQPINKPDESPLTLGTSFEDYFQWVLSNWPSFNVAQTRLAIANQEIQAAEDSQKPKLDVNMGYSTNSLGYDWSDSRDHVLDTEYPSWYVGLNFSMYLQGNDRAKQRIESSRKIATQARIDMDAVKTSLANDLSTRLYQVETAYQELKSLKENVQILQDMLRIEQENFDMGAARLIDLYDRESRVTQAKQKFVEGLVNYELAKVALRLSEGSLLGEYQVVLEDMPSNQNQPSPVAPVAPVDPVDPVATPSAESP